MTKAREIAELGQKLTVDGSGNIEVAGNVTSDGLDVDGDVTLDPTSNFVTITGGTNDNNASGITLRPNWGNTSDGKLANELRFQAADNNTTNAYDTFATIQGLSTNWTADSNIGGRLIFNVKYNNASKNALDLRETESVFNNGSNDRDFRVESDNNAFMFKIDASSDYALFGQSGINTNGTGVGIGASGFLYVSRDSNAASRFNRKTSYGDIVELNINGNRSGRLGAVQTGFYIEGEAQHSGLRFASAGIIPRYDSADSDGGVNLGEAGNRFSRLFLTGGISDEGQSGSETVFNENSTTADFRVESDGNTHNLFLDAGTGRIGIRTASPAYTLDVVGDVALSAATSLVGKGGVGGDTQLLYWQGTTAFYGRNSLGGSVTNHEFRSGGTTRLSVKSDEVVVNDTSGDDYDFRVEGSTRDHLLFVDASTDRVGIGTPIPASTLHIVGDVTDQTPVLKVVRSQASASNNTFTLEVDSSAHTSNISSAGAFDVKTSSGRAISVYGNGNVVINEGGQDNDFRIESSSTSTQFFLDASEGYIGINEGTPSAHLDVKGAVRHKVLAPNTHGGSGGANTNWYEVYRVDFQSSSFNTNQHYIRITGAGGTSGQHGSAILEVSFKQQSGSKFFNIFPLEMSGIEMGYTWDASGGDGSQGRMSIYARSIGGNYMYIQPFVTSRDANPDEENIRGTFPMTNTGTSTKPSGLIDIHAPLYLQGQRYTTSGNTSSTFHINRDGNDIDFRVSSDAYTHALYVDSSANQVLINNSVPVETNSTSVTAMKVGDWMVATKSKSVSASTTTELIKFARDEYNHSVIGTIHILFRDTSYPAGNTSVLYNFASYVTSGGTYTTDLNVINTAQAESGSAHEYPTVTVDTSASNYVRLTLTTNSSTAGHCYVKFEGMTNGPIS